MEGNMQIASMERAKVYGLIYGILNLFNAVLFFSTSLLIIAAPEQRLRAYTLVWISALMIAVVAVEMMRSLYEGGANPLALTILGILNIVFVAVQLTVFADIMVYDIAELPLTMLLVYLVVASIGVLILIAWMALRLAKARKQS